MLHIIMYAAVVAAGVLLGNGAVFVFNRLPASWLCDYGEVPAEDKLMRQRINSTPWKALFSVLLTVCGVWLAREDFLYALSVMIVLWILILISISDAKYMIIPDQCVIALAVCSFGFVNYHDKTLDMLYGALLGAGAMLAIALSGKLIAKGDALGFGDVKLMAALGFIAGFRGTALIIAGMSILSAMAFTVLLAMKKVKKNEGKPLAPYISAAALIYFVLVS